MVDFPTTGVVLPARYRIIAQLGGGSMGTVYRVHDRLYGQDVALKTVRLPDDIHPSCLEDELLSLANEFRLLAGLRHPNVISVLDYGFDAKRWPYYTMELLDGARDILEVGRGQPLAAKLMLLLQALEALAYLHRRGVLHHDVKPSNMLVADGRVHLLDFGLSTLTSQPRSDDAFGTLLYLAPEVLNRQAYTEAADLYSIGVIAYELLVGRHPTLATTAAAFVAEVRFQSPDLTPLAGEPSLAALIRQLLAKTPAERPVSAQAAIAALRQAAGGSLPEDQTLHESYLQAATFVGREQETSALREALLEAHQGRGSAWLIGGESGIGKSRLLEELRILALVDGFLVLRGQAVEGGGLPYHLWRAPLRHLLLDTSLSDREAGIIKPIVPTLEAILDRNVPDPPPLPGEAEQIRLVRTIVQLFQQRTQPTLLLLEDLHWSAESLLPLQQLSEAASELPLLILASYRSDERQDLWAMLPRMTRLSLGRLNDAAIAALSHSMLGDVGTRQDVLRLLNREAEGNVFFLIELIRALTEACGGVDRIGQSPLPDRIASGGVQQVVRRSLQRVPAWAQPLLDFAAVAGRAIDLRLLDWLLQPPPQALSGHSLRMWLIVCAQAAVLEVAEQQWRFRHDKIRQQLLEDLGQPARAKLHRQVAEALEQCYPGDQSLADVLLEHWQQVDEPVKIVAYTQAVVERDLIPRANLARNQALVERALALTRARSDMDQAQMALLWGFGNILIDLGDMEAAEQRLNQSLEVAQRLGESAGRIRVLRSLGLLHLRSGRLSEAETYLHQALDAATQGGAHGQLAAIFNLLGTVAVLRTEHERAERYLHQSLALCEAAGEAAPAALVLNNLGILYRQQRRFALAEERFSRALAIHRQIVNLNGVAIALGNLAKLAYRRSEFHKAERLVSEALTINRQLGTHYSLLHDLWVAGLVQSGLARWEPAARFFTEALALADSQQEPAAVLEVLAAVAIFLDDLGQLREAAELAGYIDAHPAMLRGCSLEFVQPLMTTLRARLPGGAFASAQETWQVRELTAVVGDALASLATHLESSADSGR